MYYLEVPCHTTNGNLKELLFFNDRDIQCRLEDVEMIRCMKILTAVCQVQDIAHYPESIKVIQMSPEVLSAVDKGLRNNDDLKAKNLKTKLLEQYTNFA